VHILGWHTFVQFGATDAPTVDANAHKTRRDARKKRREFMLFLMR